MSISKSKKRKVIWNDKPITKSISDSFNVCKLNSSKANILIIGLTYALGTNPNKSISILKETLKRYQYTTVDDIRISDKLKSGSSWLKMVGESARKKHGSETDKMRTGTALRKRFGSSILAELALWEIYNLLDLEDKESYKHRKAIIVYSFKHPEEVKFLRSVFKDNFFCIAIFQEYQHRLTAYMFENKKTAKESRKFLKTDRAQEGSDNGQRLEDVFSISSFIIEFGPDGFLKNQVHRALRMLFGYPFITPTFDEEANFLAHAASLKSSDLSRQVGAAITKNQNIISLGANEPPKFGGGTYWPINNLLGVFDVVDGRDYIRSESSNDNFRNEITNDIVARIVKDKKIKINEESLRKEIEGCLKNKINEYGRSVHAEMDAICSAARLGVSLDGATLYTTTFPCHNCAKHIIASGIARVVFMQPYPKSEALNLHNDSFYLQGYGIKGKDSHVRVEHFKGVCHTVFEKYFSTKNDLTYGDVDRKEHLNNLNKTTEKRMVENNLRKTLTSKTSKNSVGDKLSEFSESKYSRSKSKYMYECWLETAPELRYSQFVCELHSRVCFIMNS